VGGGSLRKRVNRFSGEEEKSGAERRRQKKKEGEKEQHRKGNTTFQALRSILKRVYRTPGAKTAENGARLDHKEKKQAKVEEEKKT